MGHSQIDRKAERWNRIIDLLDRNRELGMTAKELAYRVGIQSASVRVYIREMMSQGWDIEQTTHRPTTYYLRGKRR